MALPLPLAGAVLTAAQVVPPSVLLTRPLSWVMAQMVLETPPTGSAKAKYSFWPADRWKPAGRTRCQLEPRSVER